MPALQCKECLLIAASVMLLLFAADASLGPDVSPWIAYVLPVALASRYCGLSMGAAYSVIAAGLILMAAQHSGHPYSGDAYFVLAVAWKMVALFTIAWLIARLAMLERMLRAVQG